MPTFKPLINLADKVRKAFLNGDILKIDGGASTWMFIIPRDQLNHPEVKGEQVHNIATSTIPGAEKIPRVEISKIIDKLEEEGYTVLTEYVSSGCCQYHTNIHYLAGE